VSVWTDLFPKSIDDLFPFQELNKFRENQEVLKIATIGPSSLTNVPNLFANGTNTFTSGVPGLVNFSNVTSQLGIDIDAGFTRLRPQGTGYYIVTARAQWDASNAGRRGMTFKKNTVSAHSTFQGAATSLDHFAKLTYLDFFAGGDSLTVEMFQDSGGDLLLSSANIEMSWLSNSFS